MYTYIYPNYPYSNGYWQTCSVCGGNGINGGTTCYACSGAGGRWINNNPYHPPYTPWPHPRPTPPPKWVPQCQCGSTNAPNTICPIHPNIKY